MNKEIRFSGYNTVPSDYDSPDGQLACSINLIPEQGALHPILPPKVVANIGSADSDSTILYIHETSAFKHYITYNKTTHNLGWRDGLSGQSKDLRYLYNITHVNSVGNTLIVFTESGMWYLLWSESDYVFLGNELPDIRVSFGLVGHPRLYSVSDKDKKTFNISFDGIAEGDIRSEFSDANKTKITSQVMAKLNKFIADQTVNKGRFCFPFFVRYALRLYDGSLVHHSAPILMNPSTKPAPIVLWNPVSGKKSYTDAECDIFMVAASLDYQVVGGNYDLDKWKDIISSIDVFISKPIYTYDQDGEITGLTDTDNFDTKFIGRLYHKNYHRGGYPSFAQSVTEDCMLTGISGVDFLDHYLEIPYRRIYPMYFSTVKNYYPGESFHLPEFTDGKISENLKNCCNFYKLHTISFEDIKSSDRKDVPIEDDYLQSLLTRESMTDDYLTHDRLIAETSQAFNSRLNLSGVKRELYSGFAADTLFAFRDATFSKYSTTADSITTAVNTLAGYLEIDIYIKENGRTYCVSTEARSMQWMSEDTYASSEDATNHTNPTYQKCSAGCYLFYPNVNAFKMVIRDSMYYTGDNSSFMSQYGGIYVVDLKPHDFLNGSFALLDYEIQRKTNYTSGSVPTISPTTSGQDAGLVDCGNKVYTSEVNNPFFFPLLGINTVGTGKIMGICAAVKALSQGQFGQFPLYAFTDEGVWALETNAQGTYSARQPVTRDVCINAAGITQIDSAVLFPTDRGIMLISGSQLTCISEAINCETPFDIIKHMPHMADLHARLEHEPTTDYCLPIIPFTEFLKHCRMIYDYVHQRLIVYAVSDTATQFTAPTYAYVYSFESQQWGMMFSDIVDNLNSYPEALAINAKNQLVNFSLLEDTTASVKGMAVTRPLKLDAPDCIKTINNVIQRGLFNRGDVQTVLYGSRDLVNWFVVFSSKDHYLRGFRGTGYKYFRLVSLTDFSVDKSLAGASVQYDVRQNNQPR